jgi:hypothetical protein
MQPAHRHGDTIGHRVVPEPSRPITDGREPRRPVRDSTTVWLQGRGGPPAGNLKAIMMFSQLTSVSDHHGMGGRHGQPGRPAGWPAGRAGPHPAASPPGPDRVSDSSPSPAAARPRPSPISLRLAPTPPGRARSDSDDRRGPSEVVIHHQCWVEAGPGPAASLRAFNPARRPLVGCPGRRDGTRAGDAARLAPPRRRSLHCQAELTLGRDPPPEPRTRPGTPDSMSHWHESSEGVQLELELESESAGPADPLVRRAGPGPRRRC